MLLPWEEKVKKKYQIRYVKRPDNIDGNQYRDISIEVLSISRHLNRAYVSAIQHSKKQPEHITIVRYAPNSFDSLKVAREMHDAMTLLLKIVDRWIQLETKKGKC